MGCVPQKREVLFQRRPKLQTPKHQNMFFQCPHHHAIQTSTNAGWALNFTSITSKQIDQWVQMSLPHLPQTHTHNWGSKQSHMHDPTIFQNKASRCQTTGPKALEHFLQLSYKKCHFDIFYHFNTSFYNIPFIRYYIFQFYTLK